jgi:putative drug exporter of the RND superfamily
MFERLGQFLVRRAHLVLWTSAVLVLGAAALAVGAFGKLQDGGFTPPGAESSAAQALTERSFGGDPNLLLLVHARTGTVDDPAVAAAGRQLAAALQGRQQVGAVTSYWNTRSPDLRSADGRYALVLAHLAGTEKEADTAAQAIIGDLAVSGPVVDVRAGGPHGVGNDIGSEVVKGLALAESIAIPVTLVLLLITFGSVVSAVIPLVTAIMAIIGTFAGLYLLGSLTPVSIFATNLTTALGLGLAIDYALLTVGRFREELAAGRPVPQAVSRTVVTAGRTIAFSAATVTVALSALLVFTPFFLRSLAYAGIAVVAASAVCGTVILPAALAVLGHRINAGRIPWLRSGGGHRSPLWGRIAAAVMRRPLRYAVPIVALLLAAAAAMPHVRFATPDDRMLPPGAQSRQVGDILRAEFGGDRTATVNVVTTGAVPAASLRAYARALSTLPGVGQVDSSAGGYLAGGQAAGRPVSAAAQAGRLHRPDAEQVIVTMAPGTDPQSDTAQSLVRAVRAAPAPAGVRALVGGTTAALVDAKHATSARLPLAVLLVALTTFALLALYTGSLIQPLRALLLNALGLSAILGAMVLVFQDGHLSSLLGITPRALDTSMPIMLFCIAFGLSMDYEVFLISRIKELRDSGWSTPRAVVDGLGRTGRVISTAAALIAVSFFSFAVSSVSFAKFFGIGAGLAIVIDATLMRGVLVPASFRLLGERAWYSPRLLRRLHQRAVAGERTVPTGVRPPVMSSD